MSDSKQTDSDRAMARLLAGALRHPGASDSACPDAEILAAYAEHNLDTSETAQWEQHFAGCGRCQKILAVLTVSAEEPLTDAELERFGRKVAAAELGEPVAASSRSKKKVKPFERPQTAWRWLAPAMGIAAAAALWIALRPVPRSSSVAITAQNHATEPAAPDESLEAQTNVPPPPAAAERDREQQPPTSPENPLALKKESSRAGLSVQAAPARGQASPQATDEAQVAQTEAPSQSQPVLQAANKPVDDLAKAKQSEETAGLARPAARSTTPPSEAAAAAAPLPVPSPAPAASADASPRLAAPQSSSGSSSAQAAAAANATPQDKTAPDRTLQLFTVRRPLGGVTSNSAQPAVTIKSPSGNAMWSFGPGGGIAHSTDHGRTWHTDVTGVSTDLTSGIAISDKAVWILGSAGVVLRTIDGEHWQRLSSPDATSLWSFVQVTDARHATISDGSRRFTTEDGGQTWKKQ